ncbi:hypothetical protein QBC37DRAFT_284002 [Rhypophila decipiens]|uniref:Uncharacterized protein n=1 Tax=Rhypophila decipiens TaxID=261697 RepID=A0AAN7B8Y3_9PEZI|nr:hypothetical protein QBC37DRAFT_284002 [Rhypophila decipiens]
MEHNNQRGSVSYKAVSSSERPRKLPLTKRPGLRSIGTWPTITLALSTVVLVSAIVFLAIFWQAAFSILQGRNVARFWMQIIQSGQSAITITITSAFIRTAISLQAGVATSMLSSIIVERAGISLWKLPMLSMIRSISVGPQTLAWPLLRRPFRKTPVLHLCIVLMMLVITIVAQFTSTILLSDFATETVVLPQNTTTVTIGFSDDTPDYVFSNGGINYWNTAPSVFPRFAEYGEPVETTEGVADTGLSLRAFIPLANSSTRSSLRSYSGPATVLDARVVCVRPILTDVLLRHPDDGDAEHIRFISGTVASGVQYSTLDTFSPGAIRHFNCTIITPKLNRGGIPVWYASLCQSDYVAKIATNPLSDTTTGTYLVFNTTGLPDPLGWQGYLSNWTVSNSGAWTTMEGVAGDFAQIISASLCFSNSLSGYQGSNLDNYNVEYSSNSDFTEPPLEFRLYSLDYQPVADRIVDIFCGSECSSKTLNERGILVMKQQSNWTDSLTNGTFSPSINEASSLGSNMGQGFYWRQPLYEGSNASLIISIDNVGINSGHVFIFSTILRRTGNPALGLQYLFTTIAQMAYYERKPYYDIEATAETVLSESLLVPRRWTGFIVVAALASVHLLLVVGIITAFLATTKVSLLGNSWMAVAQVLSQDMTDNLLDRASQMSDEEVREVLRSSGRDGVVRLPGPRMIGTSES